MKPAVFNFIFPCDPAREGFAVDVLTDIQDFRRHMNARAARIGPDAVAALGRQWPSLLSQVLAGCMRDTAALLKRRTYTTLN